MPRLLVLLFLCVSLAPGAGAEEPSNVWSEVRAPTPGAARAIGGYADGCLAGGVKLPADGPGFEVIRLSRHRYYGHPDLIRFIERLGQKSAGAGLPLFYVGDMAQPRGGPLPYGHASHQIGLDVDIWFNLDPKPIEPAVLREDVDLPSMLTASWHAIDPTRFGPRQVKLLRLAASDPGVERIFVNPAIKQALCRGVGGAASGDRAWFEKIRPWWGHDEHFHVRLRCPEGSPDCVAQRPVPEGDGCDPALDHWVMHQEPPIPVALRPRPLPHLPEECRAVLDAR